MEIFCLPHSKIVKLRVDLKIGQDLVYLFIQHLLAYNCQAMWIQEQGSHYFILKASTLGVLFLKVFNFFLRVSGRYQQSLYLSRDKFSIRISYVSLGFVWLNQCL